RRWLIDLYISISVSSLYFYHFFFFFNSPFIRRCLHSFPTRRSSDLILDRLDLSVPDPVGANFCRIIPAIFPNVQELTLFFESKRSEEHTSELQSRFDLVCRLLLEKKNH